MTYATKFKDFGVRKVFILAIVAKAPETYRNMRVIIQKTQLNKLDNLDLEHTVQRFLVLMGNVLKIRMGHGTRDAIELCKPYWKILLNG